MTQPTKTFLDVAGQSLTVKRPPDDYLVVADTSGTHFFMSKALLADDGLGQLMLDNLKQEAA